MDWNNVDLNDGYERDQNILDPYSFDTLLLEISCNLKVVNAVTVRQQFQTALQSKIQCATEVFEANLTNIVVKAIEEKNQE
jgi:hypothetical protein